MLEFIFDVVTAIYFTAAGVLLCYGLNCYVMIALFSRKQRSAAMHRDAVRSRFKKRPKRSRLPFVTTQIPVYNEVNVVERIMRAACEMTYPRDRHEIQVLDDSTDETGALIDAVAVQLRAAGHDLKVVRRHRRTGFKAGALRNGMIAARGELLAVFDADFVPPPDYLMQTVPFFLDNQKVGLVQARWGHLNRLRSFLTQAQSIGIDGHFMVEQSARNWNGLFMNFNGTAGLWRQAAIAEGGGWQWDTLTEDMDLSYRVQLAGWETVYLPDVVVPAEIPEDVRAFKSQQFRWAKGSIQTAIKLLPDLIRSPAEPFKKLQAIFHMTHYLVHPLILTLALLALPVLLTLDISFLTMVFAALAAILILSMVAPSTLYTVSQRAAYPDRWMHRLAWLPVLVCIGVGIAVSNSRAVFEAVIGLPSDFIRTPKRGDREIKRYTVRYPWTAMVEIALGVYCLVSLLAYLWAGNYLIGPFLAIYTAGFLSTGLLTVKHSMDRR